MAKVAAVSKPAQRSFSEPVSSITQRGKSNMTTQEKPSVTLIGRDGNAFAILGACRKAMRKARWDQEKQNTIMEEMMAGDYDHLLGTAMKYFDVD